MKEKNNCPKHKMRLKVRMQRFWYGILDSHAERRYRRQRAKRGYSDCDVWDIPAWFVCTLRPMLETVLANVDTSPKGIDTETWKEILEEMVTLLKVMDQDDEVFVREYLNISVKDFHIDTCNRVDAEREAACTRFMELFSTWYWALSL